MSAPIRFCFDYVSPYAYLAWTQIHALADRRGRRVEPVPIVFGAVLDARGQRGVGGEEGRAMRAPCLRGTAPWASDAD